MYREITITPPLTAAVSLWPLGSRRYYFERPRRLYANPTLISCVVFPLYKLFFWGHLSFMTNRTHSSLFVSNICHNVLNVCYGSVRFVSTIHSVKMGGWEFTEISCAKICSRKLNYHLQSTIFFFRDKIQVHNWYWMLITWTIVLKGPF